MYINYGNTEKHAIACLLLAPKTHLCDIEIHHKHAIPADVALPAFPLAFVVARPSEAEVAQCLGEAEVTPSRYSSIALARPKSLVTRRCRCRRRCRFRCSFSASFAYLGPKPDRRRCYCRRRRRRILPIWGRIQTVVAVAVAFIVAAAVVACLSQGRSWTPFLSFPLSSSSFAAALPLPPCIDRDRRRAPTHPFVALRSRMGRTLLVDIALKCRCSCC